MFEINPSRKTQQSDNIKSDKNNIQQRAFLNEPQDTLELSTRKKKKSISFGSAVNGLLSKLSNSDNDTPISEKAVRMLKDNNIVDNDFEPEKLIVVEDYNSLSDMPVAFQRKLAIDMLNGKPNSQENIVNNQKSLYARITYNEEGKPFQIIYSDSDEQPSYFEEFEYAHKQDGSPVLIKQNIYKYNSDGDKELDNEITYHKHKNGAVTISSTDGRQMSYSLRKETIRDYENTPQIEQNLMINTIKMPEKSETVEKSDVTQKMIIQQTNVLAGAQVKDDRKVVKKAFEQPNPVYPHQEYTQNQLNEINTKFEKLQKSLDKDYISDENAFMYKDPIVEGLDKIKQLVLDTKDPIIQKEILRTLAKMKDNDVPTNFVGSYNRLDLNNDFSELPKIYTLAKLSALIDKDMVKLDDNHKIVHNLDEKLPYTGGRGPAFNTISIDDENKKIEAIFSDELLSEDDKNREVQSILHNLRLSELAPNLHTLTKDFSEIKDYLIGTYVRPNIPNELHEDLDLIEKTHGKTVIPLKYSNFSMENLENFHNLPNIAKEHYLQHSDMCKNSYLSKDTLYGINLPYDILSSLSEKEWNIFEKRNMADVLDIITGNNVNSLESKKGMTINTAINMTDEEWQKLNDFKLFEIGIKGNELSFEKHRNVKFKFEQSKDIIDNMSYKDWEVAQKRGLIDMTSNLCAPITNYERHIGVPVILATTKVPDSTFNFLKDKIELFKDNKLEYPTSESVENIATGILFLAKSHGDVYSNVQKLCDVGIKPNYVMDMVGICAKEYNRFGKYNTEKILELKNKGFSDFEIRNILTMYIDMQAVKGKSNINELSIDEKRGLLKNIVKYNATLFSGKYSNLFESEIIPKNKEEYCTILPKLVKSIGIDTRPVTQKTIDNFDNAIFEMSKPDSEFLNTKITKDSFKPQLEYPRDKFISDVVEKTSGMDKLEQNKVFDYFGFDLKQDNNGNLQMHGYPVNLNNGAKLSEIDNEKTKNVIEEIRPLVEKFANDNEVIVVGKPEITKQLNDILGLFPELHTIIGKKQHKTHDFTVDVHTLKVLQGVMSDDRYSKLSENDKKILCISTLLHDLTKLENSVDKTHPAYSAYDSYYLLNKMNMSEEDKTKIYTIIKNHEWLERYNGKVKIAPNTYRDKTLKEKEIASKNIAFDLKEGNNFELASILTKADMKAVKETDEFFNKFSDAYVSGIKQIEPLIDDIKKTAIHLPQTKLPKASELKVDGKNVIEVTQKDKDGNEIKNKVVILKPNMDLGKIGFEKGLNSNDLNVIVHALDYDTQSATLQALGDIDSDSLLSSSYVNYKKGNYHVFRQQGFILDVNSEDIQAGTYKDFGSGYGKDLDTLKQEYLFNGDRKEVRNFMSDNLKKRMNLSDEDYKKLYPEIANKSITELDKFNPEVAKNLREMFLEMDVHRRKHGRDYNEWLVSRPKIKGVFLQSFKYDNCIPPEYLAKYASENDLPVIYFGE